MERVVKMEYMGLNEIREKFLSFFESKGHLRLPSFSLVPQNDASLLLINSGMAPLKPYFTGKVTPPRKRVTTCQKCIRTPDIERVGKTARHGTFFEMLGNFSFGDYFKPEAIPWAWEFITEVMKMPVDRLWISIYEDDDEAFDIWTKQVGVAPERIVRLGKEDNFWEHGTGPCGPCSEIHFDRGAEYGCGSESCGVGCDCDRFMEFWNLVFTQFDKGEDGNYTPLPNPNIDTGMGLERLAAIMQGVDNLFEVDTIKNIMAHVSRICGVEYKKNEKEDISLRVVTDHIRSTVYMVCDGIVPSNEGRGYVLRRLLRRAARHGKLLGINRPFLYEVADTVIKESESAYPELAEKADYIKKIIKTEEERFDETIDNGLSILNGYIAECKKNGKSVLDGESTFKLYDTYGFPIDLTVEIAAEQGLSVDEEGFQKEMQVQRETARAARKEGSSWDSADDFVFDIDFTTKFIGYDQLECESQIVYLMKDNQKCTSLKAGEEGVLFFEKTVFYGESGGQVGDTGLICGKGGTCEVFDAKKLHDGKVSHNIRVTEGEIKVGDIVNLKVDIGKRRAAQRNHSVTHLLQKALQNVLGDHVTQAGSLVMPEKMRFDFHHFQAVTAEELQMAEAQVNEQIREGLEVIIREMPIEEAKKMGAMALFGEKYGELVRVVKMGDYSIEFCGGCHVKNTSDIGMFKIVSESGVAAGVRRIEGITGESVYHLLNSLLEQKEEISGILKTNPEEIIHKAAALTEEMKEVRRENEQLKSKLASSNIDDVIHSAKDVKGIKLVTKKFDGMDVSALRNFSDLLRDKLKESVVAVLASVNDGKVTFIASCSKDCLTRGVHCGNIVKEVAAFAGGRGGGKPDSAQAGAADTAKADGALASAEAVLMQQVKD